MSRTEHDTRSSTDFLFLADDDDNGDDDGDEDLFPRDLFVEGGEGVDDVRFRGSRSFSSLSNSLTNGLNKPRRPPRSDSGDEVTE